VALLGGKITVPTLTGEAILKVEPGTQPNTKAKMTGKGIKKLNNPSFGDQYVELQVVIPKELNSRQKELVQEFAKEGEPEPGKPFASDIDGGEEPSSGNSNGGNGKKRKKKCI